MHQTGVLLKIGSKVKVDLNKLRDSVPNKLLESLIIDPCVTVIDYKMTDGGGIGFEVELSDGSISWFFYEEVERPIEEDSFSSVSNKTDPIANKNITSKVRVINKNLPIQRTDKLRIKSEKVVDLINPLNFFKWLFYSLKDVY